MQPGGLPYEEYEYTYAVVSERPRAVAAASQLAWS